MTRFDRKVLAYIGAAWAVLALGGLFMMRSAQTLSRASEDLHRTHLALHKLEALVYGLSAAETAQRDYLLTGERQLLHTAQDAFLSMGERLRAIREHAQGSPLEPRLAVLEPLLARQLAAFQRAARSRGALGPAELARLLRQEGSSANLERIHTSASAILEAESGGLRARSAAMETSLERLRLIILACGLLATLVMANVLWIVHREMKRRIEAVGHLEQSNFEINLLDTLVEALQASESGAEVCVTAAPLLAALFPSMSGSLALLKGKGAALERALVFGPGEVFSGVFEEDACWALRRGHGHLNDGASGMACGHLRLPAGAASYCVPLMPHGRLLGVFSLLAPHPSDLDPARRRLAGMVAEQLSLALANLELRESLQEQSRVDPLTGLFNRRHMAEAFERERRHSEKDGRIFGLIMADIDHFKAVNDQYGHEAGDLVLKAISDALRAVLRPHDIVSRFGGEEIVALLPGAGLDESLSRAEDCRRAVEGLSLFAGGKPLGRITISLGVAAFPSDGASMDELLRRADLSLYFAKEHGRNQVGPHELPTLAPDREVAVAGKEAGS